MKKKVSILTMILACVLTCFCTFIVSGTNGIEEIKVLLNKNINVVVDGEVKNLYDVDGNRVYLISYKGTTYAPIRGVGELFDYEIDWDSETGNVLVNSCKRVDLLKGLSKSSKNSSIISSDSDLLSINVGNVTHKYDNGILCNLVGNIGFRYTDYISVPLNSDITEVDFVSYSDSKCAINIFNQQGKLLKTFYISPNIETAHSLTVDTSVTTELYFVGVSQEKITNNETVRILDIYGKM